MNMPTYRERNIRKQTRLSFQPLESSSPAKNGYSTAVKDRLASVRYEGASPKRTLRSSHPTLPTPEPSSQPQRLEEQTESEDEDDIVLPSSKRRKLSTAQEADTPTRKSTRLQSSGSGRKERVLASSPPRLDVEELGSPETSGDDELAIITKPTQRRRSKVVNDDPFIDDDEPAPSSAKHKSNGDDFIVDDDEVEYISSDEDIRPAKQKRSRRKRSRREQDELEEDLEDLKTSDVEEGRDRTRGGIVNKKRDKAREHLEELKRRRAGKKIPRVVDSDDEDVDELYGFDEQDGADIDEVSRERTSEPRSASESLVENEEPAIPVVDEDDFIVEDESQDEGGRARERPISGIPIQFTSFAKQKPKELFIHVVEWLVKNKIAPAFSRDDELYTLSWNKVNDQIKAQAGSRLISSAWNADFKNAILARPNMKVALISGFDGESFLDCDACNKSGHPAQYEFRLDGHPYHPKTLEPLKEEDASDDEDEGDEASYDAEGHLLPSSTTTFMLGRFCAANAEMGHRLTHWRYKLNVLLLEYLEEQGVLSAESIIAREKKSKKKREKEAEQIVDQMEDTGKVRELWKELQENLEAARFGMEDHVSTKGRNKSLVGKVRTVRANGTIEEWSEGGRLRISAYSDSE